MRLAMCKVSWGFRLRTSDAGGDSVTNLPLLPRQKPPVTLRVDGIADEAAPRGQRGIRASLGFPLTYLH